jgi:hypothetical protein
MNPKVCANLEHARPAAVAMRRWRNMLAAKVWLAVESKHYSGSRGAARVYNIIRDSDVMSNEICAITVCQAGHACSESQTVTEGFNIAHLMISGN